MTIRLPTSPVSTLLKRVLGRAINVAEGGAAVKRAVGRRGDVLTIASRRFDLRRYDRVVVLGAGKAAASMARALERLLGNRLEGGLVVVKYGHAVPTRRIVVYEAGHPYPDRAGFHAARRLMRAASTLSKRDLLIVLLSGGASSLLPAPVPGISLSDKQRVTRRLLRSGAGIQEVNTVRKHLSALKGGRLAAMTSARIVTLILSDVLGDDVSAIASGPTAPDPSTFRQAVLCLKRRRLWSSVSPSMRKHLDRGCRGLEVETPKTGAPCFRHVLNVLIGSGALAVSEAARAAREAGFRTVIHSINLTGEARLAGAEFGAMARDLRRHVKPGRKPCCVITGGETTVTVSGQGRGGRAQEFAVAAAQAIAGLPNVWVAAVGTDGTDGPTDAAGALVSGQTAAQALRNGIDLNAALKQNNTYPILKRLGAHIMTGPTGTNVNDLYVLLVF
ncbi:Glycerate 2-kinase [Nitrospira japonica]|uniref:Glycerate 2-kinase n=1 Tax=Nitrospira japonica TaxID=1325564 RepID=A0A1W1I432_9BACT|nr:glycerate kinase [Nitrospira japonica]SLM47711.1 Glycerate 2-kinase [Nitrospira japonica]